MLLLNCVYIVIFPFKDGFGMLSINWFCIFMYHFRFKPQGMEVI